MSGKKDRSTSAKRLSAATAKLVFAEPGWTEDEEANRLLRLKVAAECTAYRNSNGQLLLKFRDGDNVLWYSRDSVLASLAATVPGRYLDPLEGLLPEGGDFPAHIGELVEGFAALLGKSVEDLTYEKKELLRIDRVVKRVGLEGALKPPCPGMLIAFAGEVVRRVVNGQWKVMKSTAPNTWEPFIEDLQGRQYRVAIWIACELTAQKNERALPGGDVLARLDHALGYGRGENPPRKP
ncbi:MAG: hypothetical protein HZA54_10650 [Planctomycetes bacterium]|nr:hypothetical protein [Planctomycetota bacterium]